MSDLITSPTGSVQFMAAENPVKDSKTGKENYTVKLAFDVEKDKDFLAQIAELNDAKVVTERTYRGKSDAVKALLATGKAYVEAKSIYKPKVYDAAGNEMEDNPNFFSGDTATAQMIVQPYLGTKGNTINLIGIVIHTLEQAESNTASSGTDREGRLAQLRAAVEAATKS